MIREVVRVTYMNAFEPNEKDGHPAQVIGESPTGLLHLLFDDGADCWAFAEEVKEIS